MQRTNQKTDQIRDLIAKGISRSEYLEESLEGSIRESIQAGPKGLLKAKNIYRISSKINVYEVALKDKRIIHISYNNTSKRMVHLPSELFEE